MCVCVLCASHSCLIAGWFSCEDKCQVLGKTYNAAKAKTALAQQACDKHAQDSFVPPVECDVTALMTSYLPTDDPNTAKQEGDIMISFKLANAQSSQVQSISFAMCVCGLCVCMSVRLFDS